jgi:hypothetical protein
MSGPCNAGTGSELAASDGANSGSGDLETAAWERATVAVRMT